MSAVVWIMISDKGETLPGESYVACDDPRCYPEGATAKAAHDAYVAAWPNADLTRKKAVRATRCDLPEWARWGSTYCWRIAA